MNPIPATVFDPQLPRAGGSELGEAVGGNLFPKSSDVVGLRELSAGQIVRPETIQLVESAGGTWTRIRVLKRRVRLYVPGARRTFNYVPDPFVFSPTDTITRKVHATGVGYIELTLGDWQVHTPIVAAEGTVVTAVIQDATLGNVYDVVSSIGGAPAATGPVVWSAPIAQVVVGAANSAIFAANPSRRGLNLFNASTGGQRVAFVGGAAATGVRGFLILDAGSGYVFGPNELPTQQAINAWASAAGALVEGNEGT